MRTGIWVDHRKAIIVRLSSDGEELHVVESNIEGRPRPTGGSPSRTPFGPQDAVAEDRMERKYNMQLSRYYEEVRSSLQDAEPVYIFGPGEARTELKKHLESKNPRIEIAGIEAADKMTENQIKAKVRSFFQQQAAKT